ncbi:MAG: cytochrome c biogenesis CcdA family protein [Candidatus Freyarchaeota archaeon]
MKNLMLTIITVSLLIASEAIYTYRVRQKGTICVYFFYGAGCLSCARVEFYISGLERKYPHFEVYRFEVYGNRSNLALLNRFFDEYGVPRDQRKIPAVFIDDRCLVGEGQIKDDLEGIIRSFLEDGCPCPSLKDELDRKLTPLSIIVVTWAALADSVNPCAIGVLIFLLSLLSASKSRVSLLRVGLAFTASIYLAYFLFGLGLLSAIQLTGLSYEFYKFVGLLAIIVGVLNLKDSLWYGGLGFVMEVPDILKRRLDSLLRTVLSPFGAFTVGFAVCLLELPCTGGPYLYVLGLMAEKTTRTIAAPILLYYNFIFVLPLILITALASFGVASLGKIAHMRHRIKRLMHLMLGITMTATGTATLLGLI